MPRCCVAHARSSASGLQAATTSAPGTRNVRFSAWRLPRRPRPTMPTFAFGAVIAAASQFHDALLAPRRRRGLRELQRLDAVVDAGLDRRSLRERLEEV